MGSRPRVQSSRGAAWTLALVLAGCGGSGRRAPNPPPVVKGKDGREYHRLDRGAYKAYYDARGRLQRVDYDENGDGRPDHIAHHDGARMPHLIEVDEDHDGRVDRWETYGPDGALGKVGTSRRGGVPDVWTTLGPDGKPARREYVDDGRPERVETLEGGVVVAVELDLDRDGRPDRWQTWRAGALVREQFDSDGDGRPDVAIRHGADGAVEAVERLSR